MTQIKFRIYVDTSVIGGCLDEEFSNESNRLLEAAKRNKITFVVSDVVLRELLRAPKEVRDTYESIPDESIELLPENMEALKLAKAYVAAKVVTVKSQNDAIHVAYATIARVDAIVSWHFKHIVRLDRMKGYNRVNFENGYGVLEIISPKEVIIDD
ncbi:MAG: PIN domain-containing protein [Deltaproteobacteria bacterium]|nr:PIN domain-containing protein [Deltaproteobacteria bacterium]